MNLHVKLTFFQALHLRGGEVKRTTNSATGGFRHSEIENYGTAISRDFALMELRNRCRRLKSFKRSIDRKLRSRKHRRRRAESCDIRTRLSIHRDRCQASLERLLTLRGR